MHALYLAWYMAIHLWFEASRDPPSDNFQCNYSYQTRLHRI